MGRNLILTTIALVAIVLSMIAGAFFVCDTPIDFFITIGLIGIAIAVGAIIGTAIAPFNDSEGRRFSGYINAIGIFVSGYVASKADSLIIKIFDPAVYVGMTSLWSFRIVAVIAVGLAVAKLTFAFRSYDDGKCKS